MYMCVNPESRSATYQPASAAGTHRQSGAPASHGFASSDKAKSTVTGQGAAFIVGRTRLQCGTCPPLARTQRHLEPPQHHALSLVPRAVADVASEGLKHALEAE